ncbi:MAG TPA: SRPBCC family protein [Acidimicrobiia bacterium]|nr:SRPBCC family protein [Acidimicrobiia bacterium]
MTARIRIATTIDASRAQVWDVVESIEDHVDWMGDAERIEFVSRAHRGVGTEFDCFTRIGPFRLRDRMTVTEWDAGHAVAIEHRGVVSGTGRFALRSKRRGRTRFIWTERLRFPWWMGGPVGEQIAKPVFKRVWRGNLRRLRKIAEGRP